MEDLSVKEKFIELRGMGRSFDSIAKELSVSKQTLINWSQQFSVEINNFKALELDALREKYLLSRKAKVEMFGEMLNRLKEEFLKRDFSSIPPKDLFESIMKLCTVLEKEAEIKMEVSGYDFTPPTISWSV
mgnify:CR=1 FL=1